MKRCGLLNPEAGVAHRSQQCGGGCLVRARTTEGLWKLEPWQRQSPCLSWGKTSWVRCGEIPWLHLSCPLVFLPHLTWKPDDKGPGKCDFLQIQSTAKPSEAGQEQEMDIHSCHFY